MLTEPCPCGSGHAYDACCGPLLRNERQAATAEQLMRSRYVAYVRRDVDHLFRTWHPRTRPDLDDLETGEWRGLTILDVWGGGEGDEEGEVEFVARHAGGQMRERSRFVRRAGRWVYLDGVVG